MRIEKKGLKNFLNIYILVQPILDILTSLSVRYASSAITLGIVVRFVFMGFVWIYLLFMYKGTHAKIIKIFVLLISLYGAIFILNTTYINGLSVVVENIKSLAKVYYFLFSLLCFYSIYKEYQVLISDKILTIVFFEYSFSIFLATVTGTAFVSYDYAAGSSGWFYAGNEIGAIIGILSIVSIFYCFSLKGFLWVPVAFVAAFCGTYIGTKAPFFAVLASTVIFLILSLIAFFLYKNKAQLSKGLKCLALLLCILILYNYGAPIQKNMNVFVTDHYQTHISDKEEEYNELLSAESSSEETSSNDGDDEDGENSKIKKPNKLYLIANWLLSDRLLMSENVIVRFSEGNTFEKLFGLGYNFEIDGTRYTKSLEMDFLTLLINHGIVGLLLYMLPILYFGFICLKAMFRKIRNFWKMEETVVYGCSILISLACAFIAGHVLIAPAVSIYISIFIVKLYGFLTTSDTYETF